MLSPNAKQANSVPSKPARSARTSSITTEDMANPAIASQRKDKTKVERIEQGRIKSKIFKSKILIKAFSIIAVSLIHVTDADDNRCQSMIGRLTHITFPEMEILQKGSSS